ncbi:MAG: DUF1565 domain-containing protein [Planctomycetes bacterium]|nr:DUF1565 domain-containing protein [Planctomycetota bacterium]
MSNLARLLAFAFLAPILAAQTPVFVDARRGDDVLGNGSSARPYRTLTVAVNRSGAIVAPDFRLGSGTYDNALGEVFPIALPNVCTVQADPASVVPGSFAVRFQTTLQVGNTFVVDGAGSQTVVLRGLSSGGGMFRWLMVTTRGVGNQLRLWVEGCELSHSRCLAIQVLDGATGSVWVGDTRCNGPDRPVTLRTGSTSILDARLERCFIGGSIGQAVLLDAGGQSRLDLTLTNSVVYQNGLAGVMASTSGGAIQTLINHCLFGEIGMLASGGLVGAVVDSISGPAPRHRIGNTIFHRCKNDASNYSPTQYTFATCLVGQVNLGGVGGNILGTAQFADEARQVFQPRAGSPAIDRGTATGMPDDMFGHPRDSKPDIGPFEFHNGLTWHTLGGGAGDPILRMYAQVPANAGVVFFAGTAPAVPIWVPAIHLTGTVIPVATATADAAGVASTQLVAPRATVPVGTELWLQSASRTAPFFGVNAAHFVMR